MGRFVNPDNSAFQAALNFRIYVDKTGLIACMNEILDSTDAYICNSRPRRFGKSYAANMLAAYYSKGASSEEMFSDLEIGKTEDFKKHLNKYDVIHIDVQWFLTNCEDADNVVTYITRVVLDELRKVYPEVLHQEVVSLPDALSRVKDRTGQKFIIIIDEWDVLIRDESANKKVQDEYIRFLRGMFKGTEPTKYIQLAYLIHMGYLAYSSVNRMAFVPNVEIRQELIRATKRKEWNEMLKFQQESGNKKVSFESKKWHFLFLYTILIQKNISLHYLFITADIINTRNKKVTKFERKEVRSDMPWTFHKKRHLTSFQVIILGFAGVIFLGALILMLPISSVQGIVTPFHKALFTSTSAVCVTGLVVVDTASYWSDFGQAVIMILIQIGGLGVITVAAAVFILSGRKISIMQRSTMQNAISAPKVGGIVRLINFILKGTLLIEFIGAFLLMPVFYHDFGSRGIWMSFFHSISAFCNAGFDLLGTNGHPFVSLTPYAGNTVINLVIMLLIIIGGIGFFTWEDIYLHKWHLKHYHMQSKIILTTTACLILLPAIFFFFEDYGNLSFGKRMLASFFQSVTPRTAGFNTMDLSKMTEPSKAMMILLMLIGGSPSSTAGGMKTTTFALLLLNVLATFQSRDDANAFGRRIDASVIKNAATVAMMYFVLFFAGGMMISVYEGLPLSSCLFESASAVGTVGLTLGITPKLHIVSQIILIILMYLGRVGGLTLIYAVFSDKNKKRAKLPLDKITVG